MLKINFKQIIQFFSIYNLLTFFKFFVGIYLARKIDPNIFGSISLDLSIALIFISVITVRNNEYLLSRDNKHKSQSASIIFHLILGSIFFITLILLCFSNLVSLNSIFLYFILFLSTFDFVFRKKFIKVGKFSYLAYIDFISYVLSILLAYIFIDNSKGYYSLFIIYTLPNFITFLFFFIKFNFQFRLISLYDSTFKEKIYYFKYSFFEDFLLKFITHSSKILIANLYGVNSLSFYDRAISLFSYGDNIFSTTQTQISKSYFSNYRKNKKILEFILNNTLMFRNYTSIFFIILFYFYGQDIIKILLTSKWLPAYEYLIFLTPFFILSRILNSIINMNSILNIQKNSVYTSFIIFISFFVLLIFQLIYLPNMDFKAIIFILDISFLFGCISIFYLTHKFLGINYINVIYKPFLIFVSFFVLIDYLTKILTNFYISIIIFIFLYSLVFLFEIIIFNKKRKKINL